MRRLSAAFLTILLAIGLCVPSVARAEVAWNDTGDRKSAIVSGYPYGDWGRCSALMEFLGFDWSTIGNDARNKLLTNSNGDNRFTQALQQTKNLQYDAQTIGNIDLSIFNIWGSIFGYSEMWGVSLPYQTYYDTVDYVRGVITGGGGSTGGGNESPEGYITFSGNISLFNYAGSRYPYLQDSNGLYYNNRVLSRWDSEEQKYIEYEGDGSSASNAKLLPCPLTVHVSQDMFTNVPSDEIENLYLCVEITNSGYCKGSIYTLDDVTYGTNGEQFGAGTQYINGANKVKASGEIQFYSSGTGSTYSFDGSELYLDKNGGRWPFSFGSSSGSIYYSRGTTFYLHYGTSEIVTPTPPQPDPPVTPPVTPTPPIYTPTPIGDPTVTTPDYSEIIDWLEQLHRDLQAIEGQIVDTFNTLDADLANWFTRLSDYIGDMVEWLADELEQYWDGLESNIVMWLKRIYSRMGGNGATKPDPTTDPKGFWEWLLEQFASFFAGNVDDAVDTLADKLEELVQFFPFSIPWDIMALFALFAASPVTPVFDIQLPVPAIINASQHIAISIDLTPYDSTMQVVRAIEKVIFAGWLASMVPTWLNQIKVSDKL